MATTKTREIRQLTDEEIYQAIHDAKEEMFNLRFQWASGQLEDYTRIRQLKKAVARYLTILRERDLAAEVVQEENNA
ncbi:MAG TPA: 50S ribosomal protein L29 [Aggregatilinea sp.]|jgi:large subunit ribosomal protein L29|uniref:50S ribosomal protein L29 n=1 Tax=Aggregatilinea sp. TaxID=2806333 RepID=UPI002C858500|nr:50S ribosomal protein L29 [Aggregatilinea sp.]HML22131.1 50S ribosomal protein L29 [Aggregatilinea sp.]